MLRTLILSAILFLAGCISEPPSVSESIAAGYVTIETLAESVLSASDSGLISREDRAFARVQLQHAKDTLDIASSLLAIGNQVEASLRLSEAHKSIQAVQVLIK